MKFIITYGECRQDIIEVDRKKNLIKELDRQLGLDCIDINGVIYWLDPIDIKKTTRPVGKIYWLFCKFLRPLLFCYDEIGSW